MLKNVHERILGPRFLLTTVSSVLCALNERICMLQEHRPFYANRVKRDTCVI